jgi:CRP/FNR family transcriptional regulator/CRP/FNR family cyclic AMP-dependent transcriptional regulator
MFNNEIVRILLESEVFRGLTGDDLKIVSKHCQKVTLKEKDTLIQEGHPAGAFYIVVKGQLKVVLPQEIEGRREHRVSDVKLNVLKEGDCFGEYSIIDKMPASASVIATQAGELIKIAESDFNNILMTNDRVAKAVYYNILRMLIRRLRKREKEYDLILVVG